MSLIWSDCTMRGKQNKKCKNLLILILKTKASHSLSEFNLSSGAKVSSRSKQLTSETIKLTRIVNMEVPKTQNT